LGIKRNFNNYKIDGDITTIFFVDKNGQVEAETIIDTDKLDYFINLNLYFYAHWNSNTNSYYARVTSYLGKKNGKSVAKTTSLHRILLPNNKHVDHINNDILDNRISNLRSATNSKNNQNRKSKNKNNKSGYRNVCWINGYWRVQLQIECKNHLFPEKFSDVHEAGKFAKEMRIKYYGDFAGKD
jgi:hypothetical protein